jgi:hypothetical protein
VDTGDGNSPIGQHVKAASKQIERETARYDTIKWGKSDKRESIG